jgi:hypothetical protein
LSSDCVQWAQLYVAVGIEQRVRQGGKTLPTNKPTTRETL